MDYIYELLSIAMKNEIRIQLDNSMNPNVPSWCEPTLNFIMINMNFENQQ